jgi:hypothetical protein
MKEDNKATLQGEADRLNQSAPHNAGEGFDLTPPTGFISFHGSARRPLVRLPLRQGAPGLLQYDRGPQAEHWRRAEVFA